MRVISWVRLAFKNKKLWRSCNGCCRIAALASVLLCCTVFFSYFFPFSCFSCGFLFLTKVLEAHDLPCLPASPPSLPPLRLHVCCSYPGSSQPSGHAHARKPWSCVPVASVPTSLANSLSLCLRAISRCVEHSLVCCQCSPFLSVLRVIEARAQVHDPDMSLPPAMRRMGKCVCREGSVVASFFALASVQHKGVGRHSQCSRCMRDRYWGESSSPSYIRVQ